jgi:hypothetical protein
MGIVASLAGWALVALGALSVIAGTQGTGNMGPALLVAVLFAGPGIGLIRLGSRLRKRRRQRAGP